MAKSFSNSIFSDNKEVIEAVKSEFAQSVRSSENARKAVAKLLRTLTKVENNLPKSEKTKMRAGRKTLNTKSFKEFVLNSLQSSKTERSMDDLFKSARDAGLVSVNKLGLRNSVEHTVRHLVRDKLIKKTKSGNYTV